MNNLYNYFIWYNPYEELWIAVNKKDYIDYITKGSETTAEHYTDKNINNLIKTLSK